MTPQGRSSEEAFLEELRRDFSLEAEEHLQTIVSGLLELEKDPAHPVVEKVYRAAHSLKGAAHAVQMPLVATLCQAMEGVLSALKKGLLFLRAEDFDVLQRSVDAVGRMVAEGEGQGLDGSLVRELEMLTEARRGPGKETGEEGRRKAPLPPSPGGEGLFKAGDPGVIHPPAFPEAPMPPPLVAGVPEVEVVSAVRGGASQTIRISAARLDALLLQAEELISVKLALHQRAEDLEGVIASLSAWKKDLEKADQEGRREEGAPGPSEEARREYRRRLREVEDALGHLRKSLVMDASEAGTLIRHLQEGTREALLRPFSSMLQSFPKMVRDIARDLDKAVDLEIHGDDIEVDKRILEGLKDPLIHLVRNAMDHGMERPGERRAQGKPEKGTLSLLVSRESGSRVELMVKDDGRGIDPDKVREGAVKAGIISLHEAQALDRGSALRLIFRSGFSTSPIITSLSGRGLGMAIVQEGVERLGGRLTLDSTPGQGTTFCISLPLTLATFRGVLVREWGRIFVVPTAQVGRVTRVGEESFRRVENREVVVIQGEPMSCFRLGLVLGLPEQSDDKVAGILPRVMGASRRPGRTLVILSTGETPLALEVDGVENEQEILLKPLGPQLVRVRFVAGATVLGSGAVVPVLNPSDLIQAVLKNAPLSRFSPEEGAPRERPAVLVAEDSITSRTLIKNILTTAGYDVTAVVDGAAAWEALGEKDYAALVSDVEMPRMNGFELTARVRGEPRWAEIPVVLITSLESREDRERGAEAGANAYIVKSSFDQVNLLDVLGRLI